MITETSALVPPMSNVMTRGNPACAATQCAPMTPEDGPENNVSTDRSPAVRAVMTPPFDFVERIGEATPSARRSCSRDRKYVAHPLADVRVDRRQERALVLAALGPHVARRADEQPGEPGLDAALDRRLVFVVRVRVQEADRQRPAARGHQLRGLGLGVLHIEGPLHPAARTEAFVDAAHHLARGERRRRIREEILRIGKPQPPDLEDVLESARHEQAHRTAGALDQRVHGQGRPVDEVVDYRRVDRKSSGENSDAVRDGVGGCPRCRGNLQDLYRAGRLVQQHEIRERAPDVNAEPIPVYHRASEGRGGGSAAACRAYRAGRARPRRDGYQQISRAVCAALTRYPILWGFHRGFLHLGGVLSGGAPPAVSAASGGAVFGGTGRRHRICPQHRRAPPGRVGWPDNAVRIVKTLRLRDYPGRGHWKQ